MNLVITCPKCGKRLRTDAKLAGKKVRCPNPACKAPLAAPQPEPPASAPETFGLIDEPPSSQRPEQKEKLAKEAAKGQPLPKLSADREPYLQVLTDEGRVVPTDLDRIRALLLEGELTRHHEVRWVREKPNPADYEGGKDDADYRRALLEWKRDAVWRPIGKRLAKQEPVIRTLYECPASRADAVAKISGIILFAILALAALSWVNGLEIQPRAPEPGTAAAAHVHHRFWFRVSEALIIGFVRLFPEGAVFLVKLAIFLVYLGAAALVAYGVAWVAGFVTWQVESFLRSGGDESPPPDHYASLEGPSDPGEVQAGKSRVKEITIIVGVVAVTVAALLILRPDSLGKPAEAAPPADEP
jgi:hypothetical protein